MTDDRPLVILRPAPQLRDRIFSAGSLSWLRRSFAVADLEAEPDDTKLDDLLPEAFAVVGQPDLPAERLHRATKLKALMNVEGNRPVS